MITLLTFLIGGAFGAITVLVAEVIDLKNKVDELKGKK